MSYRVPAKPPKEITKIPREIKRLDEASTEKITNKWAIDEKAAEAIEKEMGEKIVPYDSSICSLRASLIPKSPS